MPRARGRGPRLRTDRWDRSRASNKAPAGDRCERRRPRPRRRRAGASPSRWLARARRRPTGEGRVQGWGRGARGRRSGARPRGPSDSDRVRRRPAFPSRADRCRYDSHACSIPVAPTRVAGFVVERIDPLLRPREAARRSPGGGTWPASRRRSRRRNRACGRRALDTGRSARAPPSTSTPASSSVCCLSSATMSRGTSSRTKMGVRQHGDLSSSFAHAARMRASKRAAFFRVEPKDVGQLRPRIRVARDRLAVAHAHRAGARHDSSGDDFNVVRRAARGEHPARHVANHSARRRQRDTRRMMFSCAIAAYSAPSTICSWNEAQR